MSPSAAKPTGQARRSNERRVAVIDLGSNSWRVVIYSYAPRSWWKRTDELYESVRVAEGLASSGKLSAAAIDKGVETLDVFSRFCKSAGIAPKDIEAVATSAVRDAENSHELTEGAAQRFGFQIDVLSEEDEAFYGYLAAVNSTTLDHGAVLDIGGGSMQLVAVNDRQAGQWGSWPLGAVRVTERLLADGQALTSKQLEKIREVLRRDLKDAAWLKTTGDRLVGIGGAVRNLATAAQRKHRVEGAGIQGFLLSRELLKELTETLAVLPADERKSVPGIKTGRGDIILASALILQTVLEIGRFEGIEVTRSGLREGIFFGRRLFGNGTPLFDDVRQASVRNLALIYEEDPRHVDHVAKLALQMHDSLEQEGLIAPQEEEKELLWCAAMLHDAGTAIEYDDHHKHSRYLILSAELPGFTPRELALIAQIARYHRKGMPGLEDLDRLSRPGDRELVRRSAMILRLAEHLERGRDQCVRKAHFEEREDAIALRLTARGDATVARWSVERYGDDQTFAKIFGRRLVVD